MTDKNHETIEMPITIVKNQFDLSLESSYDYLKIKIPLATALGGIYGVGSGYYIGGLTALYGYGFGIGGGILATAYYVGTYGLHCARKKDDYINHAISGGMNAALLVSGVYGPRIGALAAVGGTVFGAAYKLAGDMSFQLTREAWIRHRRFGLYESRERILTINKPQFPPREKPLPPLPPRREGPLFPGLFGSNSTKKEET